MLFPSPSGRRWPEGPDEGTAEAGKHVCNRQQWSFFTLAVFSCITCLRRTLTPTPLPRGEGLKQNLYFLA